MECPEFEVLSGRAWSPTTRTHVADCGSCRLVMELIDERSQAAESRDRRTECVRFEALIAVRVAGELRGPASAMLDEHIRDCADCRAIADTLAPSDDVAADHSTLASIDPSAYAMGAEVARGGMGRIVAARDLRIGRPVAVKELLSKTSTQAARFEREARVTARLQHPGIVPIYEIGKWESGTPFYAMRMVAGRTLRSALAARSRLEARLALLPSVIAAAEAVAFAHAHQVIHRDLTPANIMVGDYGETVVIDWGLAKDLAHDADDEADAGPYRRDPTASPELTAAGAVIGTASYMPPEQARGDRVDARADVYALGAILYHLLAGQAPYRGGPSEDVLRRVQTEPPAPLPVAAPRDLASIVTKAMGRSPADRYPSAKELAAELTTFQAGRLVTAHEYTRSELIRRWIGKRRGVLAVVAVAVIALGVFGAFAIDRVIDERDVAERERAAAEAERVQSSRLSLSLLEEQGRQELLAGHPDRAAALLAEVYRAGGTNTSTRFLLGESLRALEATETVHPQRSRAPTYLEPSLDEKGLLVASPDGVVVRRDGSSRRLDTSDKLERAHFSPDGTRVVGASGSKVHVFEVGSGRVVTTLDIGRTVNWAGYAADGTAVLVVTDDGGWGVWDATRWQKLRFVEPLRPDLKNGTIAGHVTRLVAGPLVVVTLGGFVTIWDWRSGSKIATLDHGARLGTPLSTAFDGNRLATCGLDGRAKVWDAKGQLIATLVEPMGPLLSCSLAPDGRVATAAVSGSVKVWSPAGLVMTAFDIELGFVSFFGDGSRLTVLAMDGEGFGDLTVREAATGTIVLHLGRGSWVANGNDGRLFIARPDGTVQTTRPGHAGIVRELAKSTTSGRNSLREWQMGHDRDARIELVSAPDGQISALDLASKRSTPLPIVGPVAISADGSLAVGWSNAGITVSRTSGEILRSIASTTAPTRLAISEDNKLVAAHLTDRRVVVWDIATGSEIGALDHDDHNIIEFDERGRLVLLTQFGPLDLWDPRRPTPIHVADNAWMIDWSPDGAFVSVLDGSTGLRVIDTASGAPRLFVPGSSAVAFDRAGHLYTRQDSTISVWSTAAWSLERRFTNKAQMTAGTIAVSPDGAFFATSVGLFDGRDGRLLVRFATGPPTIRMHDNGTVETDLDRVGFSKDGRQLIVDTAGGLRVWELRLEDRSAAAVDAIVAQQPWRVVEGRLVSDDQEIRVEARAILRGRVMRHGNPVANSKIVGEHEPGQPRVLATTGDDGTFEIVGLESRPYQIKAISRELGAFATVELTPSAVPTTTTIALVFDASISGVVRDRRGRPRANIAISIGDRGTPDRGEATTAADGTFHVRGLRGERDYPIELRDESGFVLDAASGAHPRPRLATGTTHLEGLELIVADPPSPPSPDRIDPTVYYRLTTRWQTTARSLDIDPAGVKTRFFATLPASGELWRLVTSGTGYRLSTAFQGDDKRLGVNDGRLVLVAKGEQTWTLTRATDGSYRIQLAGDPRCLSGGTRLALEACTTIDAQQWLLTPTDARTKPSEP